MAVNYNENGCGIQQFFYTRHFTDTFSFTFTYIHKNSVLLQVVCHTQNISHILCVNYTYIINVEFSQCIS